jgi:alkylhydroperoxidase/carboxymuconolactone decarboxylase family protein YurZ
MSDLFWPGDGRAGELFTDAALRAALTNGLTADEIKETLLQTAIYCGVPAANTAFRIAQDVLEELPGG